MAAELTTEQRLELLQAEYARMRNDLHKTIALLEYYRSLVTTSWERSKPPPGYWVRRGEANTVWGALIDGDLIPNGKADECDVAVEACWAHYDKLHEGTSDA